MTPCVQRACASRGASLLLTNLLPFRRRNHWIATVLHAGQGSADFLAQAAIVGGGFVGMLEAGARVRAVAGVQCSRIVLRGIDLIFDDAQAPQVLGQRLEAAEDAYDTPLGREGSLRHTVLDNNPPTPWLADNLRRAHGTGLDQRRKRRVIYGLGRDGHGGLSDRANNCYENARFIAKWEWLLAGADLRRKSGQCLVLGLSGGMQLNLSPAAATP